MRKAFRTGLAVAALLSVGTLPAAAQTHHKRHHVVAHGYGHHVRHGGASIGYLPMGASGRGAGYKELVGDPDSGVGFYPLPTRYRIGAYRYHQRGDGVPRYIRNGVLYAMMADQARYWYWNATPTVDAYKYGVYDPYDGVGTPYSAGYYGPAGTSDEPSFPFGDPYDHY